MAVVRELATLFTFQVEQSGINQYKAAVSNLKEVAINAGKLFGLAFGLEKIYSFVDGLIDAGKEVNLLIFQIQRLGRSQDDLTDIGDTLLNSALKLGVAYKDVAETFKSFLRDSQELKISQEDLLAATENIYKAMRVERLPADQMHTVMQFMERGFRRGSFEGRVLGGIIQQSPEVAKIMAEALTGGSVEKLRELAKHKGALTSEKVIEALARRNARLDVDFAKAPVKLGQALTNIYSQLTSIAGKLFKMVSQSEAMGKAIQWAFNLALGAVKEFVKALGGAEATIRLITIALTTVAATKIIPWLIAVVRGMNLLSLATLRAVAIWSAWALAIAAVVLTLEDLYVWFTGGESVVGDLLGPFDKFVQKFTDFFKTSPSMAPFRAIWDVFLGIKEFITDIMSGNVSKAFGDLFAPEGGFMKGLGEVRENLSSISFWITAIGAVFFGWSLLKFTGLISVLKLISIPVVVLLENVTSVTAAFGVWNTIKFGGLLGALGIVLATAVAVAAAVGAAGFAAYKEGEFGAKAAKLGFRPSGTPGAVDEFGNVYSFTNPQTGETLDREQMRKKVGEMPPSVVPTVPPAAVAPSSTTNAPVTDNRTNTVNQTNNITVNLTPEQEQIAASIRSQMTGLSEDMIAQMARQLTGASPRTERATQ